MHAAASLKHHLTTTSTPLSISSVCADYQAESIPIVEQDGVRVRVMAGEAAGAKGPIFMRNPGMLLDVTLAPGATFQDKVHTRCLR